MQVQDMVREFHEAFGAHIGREPGDANHTVSELRLNLIREEWHEVREAMHSLVLSLVKGANGHLELPHVAKELADLVYVTYGAALALGIDLDAVIAEVHRSNMTKLGEDGKPIYREDGKVLKGPHYEEPNVGKVLWPECANCNHAPHEGRSCDFEEDRDVSYGDYTEARLTVCRCTNYE